MMCYRLGKVKDLFRRVPVKRTNREIVIVALMNG